MKNIAISTFHWAYDFERDLSALRVNWPKVMYRPIYKGMKLNNGFWRTKRQLPLNSL